MTYCVENNNIYMTIKEIARITGVQERMLRKRCKNNSKGCICRTVQGNGGKQYEILVSSLEQDLQEKIICHLSTDTEYTPNSLFQKGVGFSSNSLNSFCVGGDNTKVAENDFKAPISLVSIQRNLLVGEEPPKVKLQSNVLPFSLAPVAPKVPTVPEKAKKIALAKVDLINHWKEFRDSQNNKKQADKDFLEMYNSKVLSKNLFEIIGKISLPTLYRWNKDLIENDGKYTALIANYNYGSESVINTKMQKIEQMMFVDLMLRPSKMSVGKAREIVCYLLNKKGITNTASYSAYKRFAGKIKRNFNDIWTLMREGEKALKDKVAPYVMRDVSSLQVGDVLVADGNTLDFQVINPHTGKPCRATMIVYVDWKSEDVAGFEIMLTENTQCIASALRHSIIRLGKVPRICYQDNGAAFRAKFFRGNSDLEDSGFYGLFGTLGIIPVYATPYNARAKIAERFFREFTQSYASLIPSYIGNCIENKPAWMKRNEKFHKKIHNNFVPTIEQTIDGINAWLEFYRSKECPNVKGKTIGEVFNEGRGDGVDIEYLDDLMMAQEERKICRNGVRMFNTYYYHPNLYSIDDTVVVKYSLLDISKVKVYSRCGDYICTAEMVKEVHAMAEYMGDKTDVDSYKQALKQQKALLKQTMSVACGLIPAKSVQTDWEKFKPDLKPVKKKIKTDKYEIFSKDLDIPRRREESKYKIFN